MVYIGAGCGLRPSEVFGLELEHVDFLRREITVVQQLRTATGRKPFLAPVKTRTSRRVVELPRVTGEALVKTVQLALGHSSPGITLNTYVGLWPDQIDRTRNLVDHALGPVPAEAVAP